MNIFIHNLKKKQFEFSVICIQESWHSDRDTIDHLKLENYELIPQGKSCSSKRGLAIYLHKIFEYDTLKTLNNYQTWEGQMIQIKKGGLKKPIIVANLYRPPKDATDKYKQFIHEITPNLRYLANINAEAIITGDTNMDLLKINECQVFGDFFDTLTENSFYPKIALPTRFSNKHGTLIDNLFCK